MKYNSTKFWPKKLLQAVKSTKINFPAHKACEYLIRLTNYDLIGRDAVSEMRVWYRPQALAPNSNFLLIIIPASVILFLVVVLKLSSYLFCQQQSKKVTLREKGAIPILWRRILIANGLEHRRNRQS